MKCNQTSKCVLYTISTSAFQRVYLIFVQLEKKLFQSVSIDDLEYFLGTSDAQVPQVISAVFAGKFQEMIDRVSETFKVTRHY